MKNNQPKWYLIDAKDKVLGRLATNLADLLRGKKEPEFQNNLVCGNKVVVINSKLIQVTGRKAESKNYYHYSGYHGGLKTKTYAEMLKNEPNAIIKQAVKGMLPKNKLEDIFLKNIYIYEDEKHPHTNVKFENGTK